MTFEEKKQEALKRMKALELHKDCIEAFEKRNEIWISESKGILFDLSQRPKILEAIKNVEEKYNVLVYHTILSLTEFGTLVTMFYVSDEEDEWKMDWEDMKENYACCFVANLDDEDCSEFGSICYKKQFGGLIRIA